jgi:hypothetical protein
MMKIIIFAAVLSAASFGTTLLVSKVPGIADNQALAIGIGFAGFIMAIYLVTMLGFHV